MLGTFWELSVKISKWWEPGIIHQITNHVKHVKTTYVIIRHHFPNRDSHIPRVQVLSWFNSNMSINWYFHFVLPKMADAWTPDALSDDEWYNPLVDPFAHNQLGEDVPYEVWMADHMKTCFQCSAAIRQMDALHLPRSGSRRPSTGRRGVCRCNELVPQPCRVHPSPSSS